MNRSNFSQYRRSLPQVIVLVAVFFSVMAANAQTATNIQVTGTVQQAAVKRLGVNLADQTYYDSGQMMKNLVFQNPGFEPQKYRSIMICGAATANTCMDDNQWSTQPTGFWNGATFQFLTGTAAGKSGTIASSTAATGCTGCGMTIGFDSSVNASVGDYFVMTTSFPGGGDAGWWDSVSGGGSIESETNDLSPNTPGSQALLLKASGSGQSASVASYFDNEDGISFIQMNGTFAVTFRAKANGNSNSVAVNVQRTNSSGNLIYLNQTVNLTSQWQDYTLTFTANETGSASGTAQLVFSASGANVYLDDVSLQQTNSSASNPTAFRDDVVNALMELQPGSIRMMAGVALGTDLIDQIQVPFARYREGWSTGSVLQDNIPYGIHEVLQLCQTVGADPWLTIPTATTPAEMQAFIQYLTGNGSDPYSAIRIARGQSAPWTSVFNKIHLELGNETWNGSFRGESMTYDGYPYQANTVFGAARATSGYDASKFDLVLDGLAASPGYNQVLLQRSTQHDSLDGAPYLLLSANDEAQNIMFGALFAEAEVFDSAGGEMYQNVAAAKAAPTPTYMNVYETNLSPIEGNITETELNNLTPSVGGGIGHTQHMLQMMRDGVVYQNAFCLPQYAFGRSDGLTVKLWGITRDMGTTNRRRPQYQTMSMANSVVGGNMLATAQTGANPTWNQPLSSDNTQLNGAHYLQSFAFQNGSNVSIIVFNLNQTTALPVTFSGNAPSGSVTMTQVTSANITDNNEDSQVVSPTTKTLSGFNPATGLTLPPFSMTVLTAAGTTTQVPSFSPAAGTYTSAQSVSLSDGTSGATIYYTTDGSTPSTSSAQYSSPISVSANETINAIAVANGLSASPVGSAVYTISASNGTVATPTISPAGGTFTSAQTVTLSDSTSGASIYYTTDGSTPSTSSARYAGAITISSTSTLRAIAAATNYTNSAVASATYTINSSKGTAATPVFSVAGGTYTSGQSVGISDSTSGAAIYYTTNGATPTTSSARYAGAISISSTTTLKAIAVATNYANSAVASATYTINSSKGTAATPVFSVAGGTYSSGQSVGISDSTSGAAIYYTTNGATPTTSSARYAGAISISSTTTLKAIAVATNYANSAVASAAYTIQSSTGASAPTFSVNGGTYDAIQSVSLKSATSGAIIYYTTNGATPTAAATRYASPIAIKSSETVKAIAVTTKYGNSAVASATYTLQAAIPAFSLTAGTYHTAESVTLRSATAGTTIYYTTNGALPSTSSTPYTGAITLKGTETLQAIAVATGFNHSPLATAAYVLEAATPVVSSAAGTYDNFVTLTMTAPTSGTTIYYTTNGAPPTTASTRYTGAISVKTSETINAVAFGTNFNHSELLSAAYTLRAADPAFSVAPSVYNQPQTVALKSATVGSTIYYTTNGTAPNTSSPKYSTPITISATTTVEAIAVATGMSHSSTVTGTYTLGGKQAATPTFSVAAGTYNQVQSVAIRSTSGATIYYTTNGATPTTSSARYTGPVSITTTETLKAIAVSGSAASSVASAAYTLKAAAPTFSAKGGSYGSSFLLTLTTVTNGATIGYSINGAAGQAYTGPITVDRSMIVIAGAIAPGFEMSGGVSAVYAIQ